MKLGKVSLGIAAAALAAAPVFAQAAFTPAVAPLDGEETEITEAATIIIAVVAAGALAVGIAAGSGGDDEAVSS